MRNAVRCAALVAIVLLAAPAYGQKIGGGNKKQAEALIHDMLMSQRLVAKVTFPAWKGGIDLRITGDWDPSGVTRTIKDHGIGIEIDQPAVVTDVKLKGKHIEIHLNGGGYGTFGDALLSSGSDDFSRGDSATRSGGSRINLRFDRDIRMEDLDAAKLVGWLAPVIDASALQRQAALDQLPAEFRDAAARGEIIVGMSKQVVFAILGEPKARNVDVDVDPPVEKWTYQPDAITTMIVTFSGGEVTKIDII